MCCDVGHASRLLTVLCLLPAVSCLRMNNFLMTGPKAYMSFADSVAAGVEHGILNAYMSFADSVAAGVERGIAECQHQFRWDKWDCPRESVSVFNPNSYVTVTREVAFVHAVTAAGVTYTLTRNCTAGHIDKCSCDDSKKGTRGGVNWLWGGCSDNVQFGEKVSRLFLDTRVTGKDARAVVNLHNNDVGRQSIRQKLKLVCKCHGVSGSCSTKTCWQQLPDFREVVTYLRRKYHRKAIKVDFQNGALRRLKSSRRQSSLPVLQKGNLVYLEKSPNYCLINNTAGTFATLGRRCSRPKDDKDADRWEKGSCKILCTSCGLRVAKYMITVDKKCDCKFHWCCEVRCKTCLEETAILTCSL